MIQTTISSRGFQQALAILKREQEANLPSRRQKVCFHLFSFFVYLFFGCFILFLVLWLTGWHEIEGILVGWLGFISLPIIPLFFLNLGLVRKLKRQARLRRQLYLNQGLKLLFEAERERSRLHNSWTLLVSLLGCVLAPLGLLVFVLSIVLVIELEDIELLLGSVAGFALTVLGLSFVFLHFMRRGKERLDIVSGLQESLSKYEKSFAEDSKQRINIDAGEYDLIARMERAQIIADRLRSIEMGSKSTPASDYTIQQSRKALSIKRGLDPSIRTLVDNQIFQLIAEPVLSDSAKGSGNEILRLPVPDAGVEIVYQIDHDNRRIKVHSLETLDSGDSSERVLGK